ncbi:MAG: permease prefix domain 1-containing protein [Eisenbergiella sp.]
MDTIRIYLENMFARLPGTPEIMKLQNDMLHTMEDKYEELKSEGKSENEAIGIVISEFGNIDELLEELGLKAAQNTEREAGANAGGGWQQSEASSYTHEKEDYDTGAVFLSGEQVEQVISDTRRYSRLTGAGTSLCIMGPALMILINGLFSSVRPELARLSRLEAVFTLFPLFLCLAAGLGMLIYGSSRLEQYKFLKHSNLILSPSLPGFCTDMQANFQPQCAVITTVGIVLCVLAPFTLIACHSLGKRFPRSGIRQYHRCFLPAFIYFHRRLSLCHRRIGRGYLQNTSAGKEKEGKKKKASVSSSQKDRSDDFPDSFRLLAAHYLFYFIWSFLFHSGPPAG